MALPPRTPEQIQEALDRAAEARKVRAEVKSRLKRGVTTLPAVLEEAESDDLIGKMKVADLLKAMPGVGKVRAAQIMSRLDISDNRRLKGLGTNQRAALEEEFTPAAA